VSARRHVALGGFAGRDVDYVVEEVGFAVLTAEIPTYDILMITQMRLAVLASVDLVAVQVDIVCQTHLAFLSTEGPPPSLLFSYEGALSEDEMLD